MDCYTKQSPCPDLEDLLQYKSGELDSSRKSLVELHVVGCDLCAKEVDVLRTDIVSSAFTVELSPRKKMPECLRELAQKSSEVICAKRANYTPERFEVGQIWSTRTEVIIPGRNKPVELADESKLVIICRDDLEAYDLDFPEIGIVPISAAVWNATDMDIIISQETSSLGYEFMIECWNRQPMLAANLDKPMGKVELSVMEDINLLLRAQLDDRVALTQLRNRRGLPLRRFLDPRKDFQLQEVKATEYLRAPVNALHEYWQPPRSLQSGQ